MAYINCEFMVMNFSVIFTKKISGRLEIHNGVIMLIEITLNACHGPS